MYLAEGQNYEISSTFLNTYVKLSKNIGKCKYLRNISFPLKILVWYEKNERKKIVIDDNFHVDNK